MAVDNDLYAHQTAPVEDLQAKLADQHWRLNNLYKIVDKDGVKMTFKMKPVQEQLFEDMDYMNVILKSRQLGFTTFIDIFILDCCLFNSNTTGGIIAHTLNDAEAIFKSKIKYPYDNLPEEIRAQVTADTSRTKELSFSNGSSIRVSTSLRSGTIQILHISEYGKISVKRPDQATEIRTGAFEAVGQGQMIFVESTAEGREGEFYELCKRAQAHRDAHKKIGPMDWKFHFYSWWQDKDYNTNPEGVIMTQEMLDYFEDLKDRGINLTDTQKAWYCKKAETQGDQMSQENPSYPEEAFASAVEGAYYASAMVKMRSQKRICSVPYEPGVPVNTFWDLGMDDATSIWFHQRVGIENRLIDYLESSGEDISYYARVLQEKPYLYGVHYFPHDASHKSMHCNKRLEDIARDLGLRPLTVVPKAKGSDEVLAGIEAVRQMLGTTYIDEAKCKLGIDHLDNYRKSWDERLGAFKRTPLHNQASHGADSIRTGAVGFSPLGMGTNQFDLEPEFCQDW